MDTSKSHNAHRGALKDQKGSIGVLMAALALGLLVLTILLLDFVAAYAAQIRAQTAADAAVLATVPALQAHLSDAVNQTLTPRLTTFWQEVSQEVATAVSSWASSRRAELMQQYADMPEPDRTNLVNSIIANERPSVRESRRRAAVHSRVGNGPLATALLDGTTLPLHDAAAYFLTAEDRGCAIVLAGSLAAADMMHNADMAATANDSSGAVVEFPYDGGFNTHLRVSSPVQLPLFGSLLDQAHQTISGQAAVRVHDLDGLTIAWTQSCP